MPKPTTQLTDTEVDAIEKRLNIEYEHDIAPHNRMLADLRALIRDRKALRVENEILEQFNVRLTTGLVNIYHVITGEACKHGVALGMATSAVSSLKSENAALREQLAEAQTERETLVYWLLRAYHSGHREGWEGGPNADETMHGLLCVLANRSYDPNLSDAAKELLKMKPRY